MPVDKSLYHPNFKWQGPLCIEQANYTCKHCGRERGQEYTTQEGKIDTIVIQAAHANHDPWNPYPELTALCEPCHNKYDAPMRGKNQSRTKGLKKYITNLEAGAQLMPLSWPERTKPPKGRLASEIRYNEDGSYSFFAPEDDKYVDKVFSPDSTAYFTWISNLQSFHFEGRNGSFTARQETRQRGGTYWFAYRRQGKQFSRYLGTTGNLTIKHLEEKARVLTDLCNKQEQPAKLPRKQPEKREVLYARIEARNEIIEQLQARVLELEEEAIKLENEEGTA
jgi:hypothetical protein